MERQVTMVQDTYKNLYIFYFINTHREFEELY